MSNSETIRVKICGITNMEDALAACAYGADSLGFVFAQEAKKNHRYIKPTAAKKIVEALPPYITTVAVVVNATLDEMFEYLDFVDRVQLHGDEAPSVCDRLGEQAIKAFRVGPGFSPMEMENYQTSAYLLDTYSPRTFGGTGITFDWTVGRDIVVQVDKPIILAGGLTPENVAEAVVVVRPYAVDTSGGVEGAPGKKDHERLRSFIHNAKTPLA